MDFEYFCRVKRCLHIVSFLVGLAMLVACSKPAEVPEPAVPEVPRRVEGQTLALSPDVAPARQRFCGDDGVCRKPRGG